MGFGAMKTAGIVYNDTVDVSPAIVHNLTQPSFGNVPAPVECEKLQTPTRTVKPLTTKFTNLAVDEKQISSIYDINHRIQGTLYGS
jgi:hypothetical protein